MLKAIHLSTLIQNVILTVNIKKLQSNMLITVPSSSIFVNDNNFSRLLTTSIDCSLGGISQILYYQFIYDAIYIKHISINNLYFSDYLIVFEHQVTFNLRLIESIMKYMLCVHDSKTSSKNLVCSLDGEIYTITIGSLIVHFTVICTF